MPTISRIFSMRFRAISPATLLPWCKVSRSSSGLCKSSKYRRRTGENFASIFSANTSLYCAVVSVLVSCKISSIDWPVTELKFRRFHTFSNWNKFRSCFTPVYTQKVRNTRSILGVKCHLTGKIRQSLFALLHDIFATIREFQTTFRVQIRLAHLFQGVTQAFYPHKLGDKGCRGSKVLYVVSKVHSRVFQAWESKKQMNTFQGLFKSGKSHFYLELKPFASLRAKFMWIVWSSPTGTWVAS